MALKIDQRFRLTGMHFGGKKLKKHVWGGSSYGQAEFLAFECMGQIFITLLEALCLRKNQTTSSKSSSVHCRQLEAEL